MEEYLQESRGKYPPVVLLRWPVSSCRSNEKCTGFGRTAKGVVPSWWGGLVRHGKHGGHVPGCVEEPVLRGIDDDGERPVGHARERSGRGVVCVGQRAHGI